MRIEKEHEMEWAVGWYMYLISVLALFITNVISVIWVGVFVYHKLDVIHSQTNSHLKEI